MFRVVIIQPPLLLSAAFIDYPYFTSLGAYQAAGILRERGWDVSVIDAFDQAESDLVRLNHVAWLGEPKKSFLARLSETEAQLVLVASSPFLTSLPGREWLGEMISELSTGGRWPLVLADMFVGGMHYLDYDGEQLLSELPRLDLVLRYEGERLLERLSALLESGGHTGSSFARGVWENHEAFPLDDLPAPAFDLMDRGAYFQFLRRVLSSRWRPGPFSAEPVQTMPLVTSRGCPFGCIFCSRNPGLPGSRRQVRTIPWPRAEGWIKAWVDSFGIQRLVILDEVANLDRGRFESMLGLLEELNLKVEFPNGLRADRLTEDHVRRLCNLTSTLKVSLESASPRVQHEVLGKDLDPDAVDQVAGWCQRHGLALEVHYLVGIPGERREEIVATMKTAARQNEQYSVRPLLQFATPLPGTELHQLCITNGLLVEQPEDLHACFQERSIIRTEDFDPAFLDRAEKTFAQRIEPSREKKVIVNLTYRCNNHCVFCAVGDRTRRDANTEEVLWALRHHREGGFRLLDIDGGEPTLHPDLFRIISEGQRLGYQRISLITNGRRLSYVAFAHRLACSGVEEVLISLHAPEPKLQEQLTGVRESFDQTIAGITNMLKLIRDPQQVAVNTTLVVDNLSASRRLGELLASLGVRRWNLQVVTPFGRARSSQVPKDEFLTSSLQSLLEDPPGQLSIQVINCPPCLLTSFENVATVDFGKVNRDMVFVGERGENLQGFLAHRRRQNHRCQGCAYAVLCPGFYVF